MKEIPMRDRNDDDRRNYLATDDWIPYKQAQLILNKLTQILNHPVSHRPPNIIVVADTNNGKSALLNRFYNNHTSQLSENRQALITPVLRIQMPPEPDEKRFYNNIMDVLNCPYKASERVDSRERRVKQTFKVQNTRILIIDEFQHILAGTFNKQKQFLNVLKYFSNEVQVSIVAAGISSAFYVIQNDEQLSNRFDPCMLPLWREGEDYYRLLASFEEKIPLKKPSELTEQPLASKILSMSGGTIGEIAKIIKLAATDAINKGTEQITMPILQKISYTTPSVRNKLTSLTK